MEKKRNARRIKRICFHFSYAMNLTETWFPSMIFLKWESFVSQCLFLFHCFVCLCVNIKLKFHSLCPCHRKFISRTVKQKRAWQLMTSRIECNWMLLHFNLSMIMVRKCRCMFLVYDFLSPWGIDPVIYVLRRQDFMRKTVFQDF